MLIVVKVLLILFIAFQVLFFASLLWPYVNYSPPSVDLFGRPWPPKPAPNVAGTFDPWGLQLLSTFILLTSGITVTWAHHALLNNDRRGLKWGLLLTIVLGVLFLVCQAYESMNATFRFAGRIGGAAFLMTSGYHGAQVIVGTLFLIACLLAALAGRFTPERHFGFEAAAWYWHFVDVVWLSLFAFACIYVL